MQRLHFRLHPKVWGQWQERANFTRSEPEYCSPGCHSHIHLHFVLQVFQLGSGRHPRMGWAPCPGKNISFKQSIWLVRRLFLYLRKITEISSSLYETSFSYRLYDRNTHIQNKTIIASKIRCHHHHHLAAKVSKGKKNVEFRTYGEGRVVGWNLKEAH